MRPIKWIKRNAIRIVAGIVGGLALAVLAVLAFVNSPLLVDLALQHGLPAANQAIPGTILVGGSAGPVTDLTLHDVEIRDENGDRAIFVERLELDWNLWDLGMRRIAVDSVVVTNPEVVVRVRPDRAGVNLATAFVDKSKPRKPRKPGGSPLLKKLKGSARSVSVTGGKLVVEVPGGRAPVDLSGLDVAATWTMVQGVHDVALTSVAVDVARPLPLTGVAAAGGARLTPDLQLDLVDLTVDWRSLDLRLDGTLGQLKDLTFDLDVGIDAFDLVDVQQIAAKAPLEGAVAGKLHMSGGLRDEITYTGAIDVADGAAIDLRALRLRLPKGEERPKIEHELDAGLASLSPDFFLKGIDGLPDALDVDVVWDGAGTKLETLAGDLRVTGAPFEFRKMTLGPVALHASIDGPVVTTRSLDVGVAGGEVHVAGTTDVKQQSFALDVDGLLADLGALRAVSNGLLLGGSASFAGFTRGTWGGDGAYPVSIHTTMDTTTRALALKPVSVGAAETSFAIDLDVVPGGIPVLRGTLNTTGERVATSAGEQLRSVRAGLVLQGASSQYTVTASRGGDLIVDADGFVEWGKLPIVHVRNDRLSVIAGTYLLEGTNAFHVTLNEGAVRVDDLGVKTETGALSVSAAMDPADGDLSLDLSLRGLDLSEVEPIASVLLGRTDDPLDHGLTGRVKDLSVDVDGTLASPIVTMTASVGGASALGRPPQQGELELRVIDGQIAGHVAIDELMTLRVGKAPLQLRLDGAGPPVQLAPSGEWDVELTVDRNELTTVADLAGVELPELVEGGAYDGLVRLEGPTSDPTGAVRVRVVGLAVADRKANLQFGANLEDGVVELAASRIRTDVDGTILELTGRAGAPVSDLLLSRLGPQEERDKRAVPFLTGMELGAEITKLEMSLVHVFAGALKPLTGALRGTVGITGELVDPVVEANIQLLGGRAGRQELHPVQIVAGIASGTLASGFVIRPKRGGLLRIEAMAPFPLRLAPMTPTEELLGQVFSNSGIEFAIGLDVKLTGEGFPMPVLLAFVPDVWESAGVLTLEGQITGSIREPVPALAMAVDDGLVCYKRTQICYEEVTFDTRVTRERVALKTFSFETVPQVVNPIDLARGGRARVAGQRQGFSASGGAALDGLKLGAMNVRVDFERTWLMYTREIKAQLHGGVRVAGELPALAVEGDLELQNVAVDLGSEQLAGRTVASMQLPDNLQVHREATPPGPGEIVAVVEEDPEPSFLDRFMAESSVDVAIRLSNNIRLKLNAGIAALAGDRTEGAVLMDGFGNVRPDLTLDGEVRVSLFEGAPYLEGQIRTGRGSTMTVLTKKFVLEEDSSLNFSGRIPDTQLDITAVRPSDYGDVKVLVTKRLASPHLEFDSDPKMDQADIMSILVTGKPLSEVGTSEGNAVGKAIAGGLSGFLNNAFGDFVPLDSLEVDFGDDLSSFSVEGGKAITPNIFFIARYNHGVEDDENRVEAQFEIRVSRRGYIEVRVGDRLEGNADFVGKLIF